MSRRQPVSRRAALRGLAAIGAGSLVGCAAPGTGNGTGREEPGSEVAEIARIFSEPVPGDGETGLEPSGRFEVGHTRRLGYRPSLGPATAQNVGKLIVPAGASEPLPVLVIIHGGGWAGPTGLGYMTPLARDVASHGVAVWNVEYRRVGSGGGWPVTLTDVASAFDAVAELPERTGARLDLNRVHVAGHSAGGHLAAWLAGRPALPPDGPGARPAVRPAGVVTMAGVFDLSLADDVGKDRFVRAFLGGSDDQRPDRYALASPSTTLPTGVPVTCLHGTADRVVSPEQSQRYVAAATALGDPAQLVELAGVGHVAFGDVRSQAGRRAREAILAGIQP